MQDPSKINHYSVHKPILLDQDKFPQPLLTHLKTSKSVSLTPSFEARPHYYLQKCQRVLKIQRQFYHLNFLLENKKTFKNKHLLSSVLHFSSLSSLSLEFASRKLKNFIRPKETLSKILTSLKRLKQLDLSFRRLAFHDLKLFKNLMKMIHKVSRLSHLSLAFPYCQSFNSLHYNFLFSNLRRFNHLRTLKLNLSHSTSYFEEILDTETKKLISVLPKLPLLTRIHLDLTISEHTMIYGSTFFKLFQAFQSIKNLSDLALNLCGCKITFCTTETSLLRSFRCLVGCPIKRLRLGLCLGFDNQYMRELSETLKELTLLKSLSLFVDGGYFLSDWGIVEFGSDLGCLTSLTSLHLSFSDRTMNKNIVQTTASTLKSLQNLVALKLEFRFRHQTEDKQFQLLFTNLKSLASLKDLDLQITDQNEITDISLETLGESLKDMSLVRNLSLEFSSVRLITSQGIEAICLGIQKGSKNLFRFCLKFHSYKKINEKTLKTIGKTLKKMVSLYSLVLCFDGYFGNIDLKELFYGLKQMRNIQEILLSFPSNPEVCFRKIGCLEKIERLWQHYYFG